MMEVCHFLELRYGVLEEGGAGSLGSMEPCGNKLHGLASGVPLNPDRLHITNWTASLGFCSAYKEIEENYLVGVLRKINLEERLMV